MRLDVLVGKGYHNVHAHTTGTGETAAQQRCVLSIESSMYHQGREGFLVVTDGGALSTTTGGHVMP
jgi:hypothetical protein